MDVFSNIMLGLGVASSLQNLMYCMIGALLGTMVGVLPGIGPVTTLALLLPISFTLDPISALIMMAGIYYGAQYGGSTTAILINIPGEASSVVTSLDGHQMARQGRAGPALGIAALGSFFAGCVAALVIAFGAPPLAKVALQFGPAEYFSLMVCGLIAAVVLAHGSIVKAIGMVLLGLSVRPRGLRHQFGRAPLHLRHLGPCRRRRVRRAVDGDLRAGRSRDQPGEGRAEKRHRQQRRARAAELGRHPPVHPSVLRGTALGSLLGVLPGGGALLASFAAYTLEKKVASHPRTFGQGDIRGVAAPESANNAGAQTSMIPDAHARHPVQSDDGADDRRADGARHQPRSARDDRPAGIVLGRHRQHVDRQPHARRPQPAAGGHLGAPRARALRLMFVAIVAFCCVGTYTINSNVTDLAVLGFFTVFGYLCLKLGCEPAPLILGFVLGPMMEENLRRALLISRGDPAIFLSSPISVGFLAVAALLLVVVAAPAIRARRDVAMVE